MPGNNLMKYDFRSHSCVCVSKFYFHFIGVEKSGRNGEGDSWWETWQEVLHQEEWRLLQLPLIYLFFELEFSIF